MSGPQETMSTEEFRALVRRAGMSMSDEDLEALKPVYEHFAGQFAPIHDLDLDAEDMAVAYSPTWEPR